MNTKTISSRSSELTFSTLQQRLTNILKSNLARHNGQISPDDFKTLFAHFKQKDNLAQRLFVESDGMLEWKPRIQTFSDLDKLLGPSKLTPVIREAFERSKAISKRTAYPLLVYSGKTHLINPVMNFSHDPSYGFSALIRPYTTFSEHDDVQTRNNLHLSTYSFGVCIHINLSNDGIISVDHSQDTVRIIWGDYFHNNQYGPLLINPFSLIEFQIENYLNKRPLEEFVLLLLSKAHAAAESIVYRF